MMSFYLAFGDYDVTNARAPRLFLDYVIFLMTSLLCYCDVTNAPYAPVRELSLYTTVVHINHSGVIVSARIFRSNLKLLL